MLIRRHMVYVDEKSIKSIKAKEASESKPEGDLDEERKRILNEAKKSADEIIQKARKEAENILNIAKEEANRIVEESKKRYEKEIEEYEKLKKNMLEILKSLDSEIKRSARSLADQVLPLVKVVVKKVLEKEIDDDLALRRLRSAFEKIMSVRGDVVVRVSPDDANLVKEEVEKLGYVLIVDDKLSKGDVVLETNLGVLNKSTDFLWRLVEDIIDEVI